MTYDGVRLTEGNALLCEMLRDICSVQEALTELLLDLIHTELGLVQHLREDVDGSLPGVDGVKDALLILLEILIVGQGSSLHDGQKLHQIAVYPAYLATDQLGHIRILLLGHNAASGAEAVVDGDIRELRRIPPCELLRPAGQMHHRDGRVA